MEKENTTKINSPTAGAAAFETPKRNVFVRIFRFYYDGFRHMNRTWRVVWIIVLVKLFIMFAILKVFFFPNRLATQCDTNEQRSEYVIEELTRGND